MAENEIETYDGEEIEEETEDFEMTPEDFKQLKELQAKMKRIKQASKGKKESLFNTMAEDYLDVFEKFSKDVITLSSKVPGNADPDNLYAITIGIEDKDKKEDDLDPSEVVNGIIENLQSDIEMLMGIEKSLRVSGEIDGKKVYFQIRKRPANS